MRSRALTGARVVLLAGPVALAFFSGGYFDGPRAWAGIVAWALVVVAALAAQRPLPRSPAARLALASLALLAAWTLLSSAWAPLAGSAYHAGQIALLYTGALLAATALLRGRAVRLVEPAIAGGALIVVGYGLSDRLLPWLVTFHHSISAQGRLDQPLTYWNAMGEVAAVGVVLCARLAGDANRSQRMRVAAAAAAAPLALGLYLSFSRGALFACAAGLVALVVAAPTRAGLRGVGLALAAAVAGALSGAPFGAVTSLSGSHHTRVLEGTASLVLLAIVIVAAALAQRALCRREAAGELAAGSVRLPRHSAVIAVALVLAGFALFLAVGAKETRSGGLAVGATRLTSLQSNRYSYWRVAWRAFRAEPVRGVGAGGWAVYWLRYRPFAEGAQDAHSLYIQTAAELGVIGVLLLAGLLGGVAWAAARAHAFAPLLAAGPIAGFVVWAAHAAVDWDWQMPAATLPAMLLAGALLGLCDLAPRKRVA